MGERRVWKGGQLTPVSPDCLSGLGFTVSRAVALGLLEDSRQTARQPKANQASSAIRCGEGLVCGSATHTPASCAGPTASPGGAPQSVKNGRAATPCSPTSDVTASFLKRLGEMTHRPQ